MNEQAKITIQRGYSEDGGFHYTRLTSDEMTEHECWVVHEKLALVGQLRELSGYEVLSAHAQQRLGDEFTVAQVDEYCAEVRAILRVREAQSVRCDCGHTVPRNQVMSASRGTSCLDCYDRMSD